MIGRRVKGVEAGASITLAAVVVAFALVLAAGGGKAYATETDKTPPVVTLSGTAVKAVEEGKTTGTYELHIVATDGSKAAPQSGVAKIEVGVDGSGQQSWEKSCPEGSCGLEEKWTYSPASYLFESPRWITVKVTDHAGNVTEEEISIEGVEEVREAAPTGPDTTAPTITFLGSAVEAVETGATSGKYELRMLARDGSPTAPQSGVSKIEVEVDGTTVQSWEKYCPIGSCRLKIQWPYTPASFTGTGHVLTVTVRDHAGNVTTRTIGPDTTPPIVELSGALTEGLKTGTTSYPLHVHATDGTPELPGSGVKSVTISVDGTVIASKEQSCPNGSCPMDYEWSLNSSTNPGEHVVEVTAQDRAGNVTTEVLRLGAPSGSLPGCNPVDPGATESTASETIPMPGGGTESIYDAGGGLKIALRSPPASFNPLIASEAELSEYGFPQRPSGAGELAEWKEHMTGAKVAAPTMCNYIDVPHKNSGTNVEEFPTWSGYLAWNAEGNNAWKAAKAKFSVSTKTPEVACGNAATSEWVGLGGVARPATGREIRLIQAGTEVTPAGHPFSWMEFIPRQPNGRKESAIPFGLKISKGNRVEDKVFYSPVSETAEIFMQNLETNEIAPSAKVHLPASEYFDGSLADFIDERPTVRLHPVELEDFGVDNWYGAEVQRLSGSWEPLGRAAYKKIVMQPGGNSQVLASPSSLGPKNGEFLDFWQHCRP